MANINQKVGNFALNTGTGSQSVTGVGFTPKAVIFILTPNTADIDSPDLTANNYGSFGFTDGTNQFAGSWFTPNAAALENSSSLQASNRCIIGHVNDSTIFSASIVSLDSDGFTINVNAAPADNWRVGYWALGGADLQAYVGDMNAKTGSTGTLAETGVGFQPECLIMFTLGVDAYSATSIDQNNVELGIGFTDGTTQRGISNWLRDGEVVVGQRHCLHSSTTVIFNLESDSGFGFIAPLTSFDADGFTLNFSNIGNADKIMYLALRGVQFKAGAFNLNTSTGAQSVTGVGFEPGGLMVLATGQSAANAISANGDGAKYMIGFATANDERFSIGASDEDNQTSPATDADHYQHSQHLGRIGNFAQTIEEQFDLTSFDDDGFTINVENALGSSPSIISYLAIEGGFDTGGGNPGSGSGSASSKDASFMFSWLGM